ncbi:MAG: phosphohydrolase [Candidatus Levybacteria bacterium]|nr:phosphohydrolase [Candidatus Levybacteria bacterium]
MNREDAYQLLTKYLKNKNLIKHSLAAEVTMRALYTRLTPVEIQNPDSQEKWGITGLLHDIDYEVAQETNQLDKHGILLFANNEVELPDDIAYAIMSHNYKSTHVLPHKPMDWAITACDQLTGLITACALVRPEKTLASVTEEAVMKKFGQKAFAAGADREAIRLCESKLDIPLDEFIKITLKAMQSIHKDLGL